MFSNVVGLHLRVQGGRHPPNSPSVEIEEETCVFLEQFDVEVFELVRR